MKKIKILGLALVVACVGVVGFSGCTQVSQPYDLVVSNAQKEFNIGDDFTLGENFAVDLKFETNKTMKLTNNVVQQDDSKKVIQTVDYKVDYSNFDPTKAGRYYIFVSFNDHDDDATNDIKRSYQVKVNLLNATWVSHVALSNWIVENFDQNSFVAPVPSYSNYTIQYSYKPTSQDNYISVSEENLFTTLNSLIPGSYTLKVYLPATALYNALEDYVNFDVLPN